MVQKLKDTFSFVKAKIGGDQLDQKLVESVSEENWQTSTHILHQIANAAYNYEKWQRISEFIWDKLKKSKSWRKILKTLNLIEFLLKNGPQSVITNFKYDIYQLRTFENYSYYSDGNDRGESIRERAKVIVNLLNNQQLLEEERVKAKTIREKMSNVLGNNNNYGAGGYSGYGGSNKSYDNYDKGNKYDSYDKKKTNKDNAYKYGNEGLGVYGDYAYNKSTLDKYKDKNNEPATNTNPYTKKQEEKKPQIVVETKKPFQQSVSKLAKPGERKQNQPEVSTKVQTNNTSNSNNDFIGILDEPKSTNNYQESNQNAKTSQQVNNTINNEIMFIGTSSSTNNTLQANIYETPQIQQQPQQQQNNYLLNQQNNNLLNQTNTNINQINQQQTINQVPQQFYPQPQVNQTLNHQLPQQNYINQQTQLNYPQSNYNQLPFNQPNLTGYPQQPNLGGFPQQPNLAGYPQQNIAYHQQNLGYQTQQQYGSFQGNPAQQQFQGQYNPYYAQQQQQQQSHQYGNNLSMPYGLNQGVQQPPQIQANLNLNISLSSNLNQKQQQQFGNFNSVNSASNVNWLSNKEKGLIDFSDFGSELKNDQKQSNKNEHQQQYQDGRMELVKH